MKIKTSKKEKNRKAFLRILKENGLYSEWIKCRKKRISQLMQLNTHESYDLFNMEYFGDILIYSFGWDCSRIPNLWCSLARIKERPKDIVESDVLMGVVKGTVEKHRNKNGEVTNIHY